MNYQEKCSTRADVRALYEQVRKDPTIQYYRGYTDKKSYGWDPVADDYKKVDGEYWFENPNYIPEVDKPRILDSGNRREFETGAVRDICEGKGRCDLLPLDVVGHALANPTLTYIYYFQMSGNKDALYDALSSCGIFHDYYTLMLEVAKHFEEGCKKYGDNNWQKGIPTHCYIDSAVRHYLKYLRGDKDEPHDRAFCWNILCCIWTCIHKPELNDYRKENSDIEKH